MNAGNQIRIALDARLEKPWASGLGRYARELCRALTALDAPGVQWVILKHPLMRDVAFATLGSNAEEVVLAGDPDTASTLWSAWTLNRLRLDVYHALENFVPVGLRVPRTVITMHDLTWVLTPELVQRADRSRLQTGFIRVWGTGTMAYAVRRASAVITVSEATRAAALERFPVLRTKPVVAVHNGLEHDHFRPAERPAPERSFFLTLGNSLPYKNVPRVIDALAQLKDTSAELVLPGRGDNFGALEVQARARGVFDRVRFRRRPPDDEVLGYYQTATALVFPSLTEGFGFPLVEAMATGCPVITSDLPVCREVCGDAALYVDPRSTDSVASGMRAVLLDPTLRASLIARGKERAARFSWRRCAEETLSVYGTLVSN